MLHGTILLAFNNVIIFSITSTRHTHTFEMTMMSPLHWYRIIPIKRPVRLYASHFGWALIEMLKNSAKTRDRIRNKKHPLY